MGEAEKLHYGACSTALCKRAFCAEAAHLEQRWPEASEYLRYLTMRDQAWPRVA